MITPCDVIMDLLPLYQDDVCSDASRKLVEDHLNECAECKQKLYKMGDTVIYNQLEYERNNVVKHHIKAVKRKILFWGIIIAIVIILPPFLIMMFNNNWTNAMIPAMVTPIIIVLVIGLLWNKKS